MAYQEQRTFEPWKTNRIFFSTPTAIRTGSNGDFEQWLWDRFNWFDYVEVEEVVPPEPPTPPVRFGIGVGRREPTDFSGGIEEMRKFWTSYFRQVLGLSEARAAVEAERMLAVVEDDEEFLMLL